MLPCSGKATDCYTTRSVRCHPMQPLASMSSTSGNYCPLSTGRQLVSMTTTPVHFARCLVASRLHPISGDLLTSLGPSSLRPRRMFVPLSPNPACSKRLPQASGLGCSADRQASIIVQRSTVTTDPRPLHPSLDLFDPDPDPCTRSLIYEASSAVHVLSLAIKCAYTLIKCC